MAQVYRNWEQAQSFPVVLGLFLKFITMVFILYIYWDHLVMSTACIVLHCIRVLYAKDCKDRFI